MVERRQLAGQGYRLCQDWDALPQLTPGAGMARQSLAVPAAVRMRKESTNATANALSHLGAHMAQDQIALAAASAVSQAARAAALRCG